MVQWVRVHVPSAGGLGLISGQGTRSHMLQLRLSTTKNEQINKYILMRVTMPPVTPGSLWGFFEISYNVHSRCLVNHSDHCYFLRAQSLLGSGVRILGSASRTRAGSMGMNPCGHAGTPPLLQSSAVAALKLLNFWTRGLDFLLCWVPQWHSQFCLVLPRTTTTSWLCELAHASVSSFINY